MTSNLATRLERHLAAITASTAAVLAVAANANAAVVYSGVVNINIPSTTSGVYLNVVTGIYNSSAAAVPGWDVNPWGASSLDMFRPVNPSSGAYVGSGTTYTNLPLLTLISSASTFANISSATPDATLNLSATTNLIGFRFFNEGPGTYHFGWMRLSLGSTLTSTRSIVDYAWETSGGITTLLGDQPTGIRAGEIPTPSAAFALAIGSIAITCCRRRGT